MIRVVSFSVFTVKSPRASGAVLQDTTHNASGGGLKIIYDGKIS